MPRSRLLAAVLLLATSASAQTFRPANGPWTRAHELVGSTPDGRIFARVGSRLGVTTDGETWTVVSETMTPSRLIGSGGALFGVFPDVLRYSQDGGATWLPFGNEGTGLAGVVDVALSDDDLYAITRTAVYRLGDLASWQPLPFDGRGAQLDRIAAGAGTVAVSGHITACNGEVALPVFFRTLDGGGSWTQTQGGGFPSGVVVRSDGSAVFAAQTSNGCSSLGFPDVQGGLFVQAVGDTVAVRTGTGDVGGLALRRDGSLVTGVSGLPPGTRGGEIAISGGLVIVGTRSYDACSDADFCYRPSQGVFTGVAGVVRQAGFVPSEIRALATAGGSPLVAADGAIYGYHAGTFALREVQERAFSFAPVPGSSGLASFSPGPPAPPFVAYGYSGGAFAAVFSEAGVARIPAYAATSAATIGGRIVTAASQSFGDAGVYVAGVYVAFPDLGAEPTLRYDDIGTVGAADGQTVYAGAVDNLWQTSQDEAPPARIFRSDDAGNSWAPDDAGMTARNVYAFTSVGAVDARLDLAGTSDGVFARTPGAAWQPAGLTGRTVFTFYTAPEGLLAGTDDGLFRRDASGTWSRYGDGLDGRSVFAVLTTTDAFGAWTGVGTDAGLFQTRTFGVASEAPPEALAGLSVSTAPNPGRGIRTVRLAGLTGRVSVAVFDGLGRRVADLGTDASADRTWDASRLPAGVYVVRATTEAGLTATARAVVIR